MDIAMLETTKAFFQLNVAGATAATNVIGTNSTSTCITDVTSTPFGPIELTGLST
jgi:hypothetical protein